MVIDFSDRANRFIALDEIEDTYISDIQQKAQLDPYYPSFHIAPPHGLLNDPNGLVYHNGKHHIFYQWFPLGPVHGLKHWYHVSTEDFVNYLNHGVALTPDMPYDQHGCFSGGAISKNDELHLYYTGNVKNSEGEFVQYQCLAKQDTNGIIYKKGPLIEPDLTLTTYNFRDPVPYQKNGQTYLLVGAESVNHEGMILLYRQEDEKASFVGPIQLNVQKFGYMWECPSYFELDEKGVFIFSPQGAYSEDPYEFQNVFSVVYLIGEPLTFESGQFKHQPYIEMDKGFDFYAPQVYQDDLGRQIMFGWLGNSKSTYPTDRNMWAHMLTIPRELTVRGNRLLQTPLSELKALRQQSYSFMPSMDMVQKSFELEGTLQQTFRFMIANQQGEAIEFYSDGETYTLNRSGMSELYATDYGTVRKATRLTEMKQTFRVFVDASSIEIFVDEGATVFTSRFFLTGDWKMEVDGIIGMVHELSPIQKSK
ncbi:sucrose-6-phosphate hydrolase [Exiguobacterium sp. MMG028]|uniref:glycoside hydrolase family 32 protein n=1 Tax=Exiguobacterium sp. MMG028 TaxID=3021979 RepID=UPI0022FEEB1A|nr:sucrose-6-phosphate hydrolase [Exiguobacterium sp. MMG028]MDA5561279.1 sucrose-6-phosphate hydrolase [Exiguobacterium sp. MMG028]